MTIATLVDGMGFEYYRTIWDLKFRSVATSCNRFADLRFSSADIEKMKCLQLLSRDCHDIAIFDFVRIAYRRGAPWPAFQLPLLSLATKRSKTI
jgi:hypothetical protein